jgi:hypothetical protein
MGLLFLSLVCLASAFSILVTGDVNLNPALSETNNLSFVWGSMLPVLRNADFLAINHESTLAGEDFVVSE